MKFEKAIFGGNFRLMLPANVVAVALMSCQFGFIIKRSEREPVSVKEELGLERAKRPPRREVQAAEVLLSTTQTSEFGKKVLLMTGAKFSQTVSSWIAHVENFIHVLGDTHNSWSPTRIFMPHEYALVIESWG